MDGARARVVEGDKVVEQRYGADDAGPQGRREEEDADPRPPWEDAGRAHGFCVSHVCVLNAHMSGRTFAPAVKTSAEEAADRGGEHVAKDGHRQDGGAPNGPKPNTKEMV